MKKFEINKKFTEIVNNYISDGYVINLVSMSGSQGEEGKVDLVKGDQLVRIWTNSENSSSYYNRTINSWNGNMLVLRIGVWKYPAKNSFNETTVWMQDFTVIESYTFYEIERSVEYTEDLNEALQIQKKRYSRYKNHDHNFGNIISYREDNGAKVIAAKYLKSKEGYKRISYDKMKIQKIIDNKEVRYVIIYNNNRYVLK